jgi:hypothetical protein
MPWQNLLIRRERLPANPTWVRASRPCCNLGSVTPFDLAVAGADDGDRGWHFWWGIKRRCACWPSAPLSPALCATEQRSLRVADMQTCLHDLRLSGRKDFVTAGDAADWLLIAARSEAPGDDPCLSLAVVYPDEPGVRVEKLAAIPLMPDVSHGRCF